MFAFWSWTLAYAVLITGWLVAVPSQADGSARDVEVVSVPVAERAAHGFDATDSAGLFVGVQNFDDPKIATVPFAVDDAVDLAHLFSLELELIPSEKVTLCLAGEPVKPESKKRLSELRARQAQLCAAGLTELYAELERLRVMSGPRGLAVVALASHGFSEDGADTIVARDSRFNILRQTGLSLSVLVDQLSLARASRQLVLVDACRERLTAERSLGFDSASALGESFVTAMKRAKGAAVLMATVLGGYSYDDHERKAGVFTASVIDGLRGRAQANSEGLITVELLADYIDHQVADWVALHKPPGASQSPGITRLLSQGVGILPLAISPLGPQVVPNSAHIGRQVTDPADVVYLKRRDNALDRLTGELKARRITGSLFDDIAKELGTEESSPERWRLIEAIESLNGSELAARGLVSYFSDHRAAAIDSRAAANTETVRPDKVATTTAIVRPDDAHASRPYTGAAKHDETLAENILGMHFRHVPGGTFRMKSRKLEEGQYTDGRQFEVTLTRSFWMGETEVTQGQWRKIMGTRPSYFAKCGDECPVEQVSWLDAVAFANALSTKTNLEKCYEVLKSRIADNSKYTTISFRFKGPDCGGYRLPTEAEWVRAAHADWPNAQNLDVSMCGAASEEHFWEWTSDSVENDSSLVAVDTSKVIDPISDRGNFRVAGICLKEPRSPTGRSMAGVVFQVGTTSRNIGFRLVRTAD